MTERLRGRKWMAIRSAVFERDRYKCQGCGRTTTRLHCDHIIRLADGGTNKQDNLQSLCHECHADKTAQEDGKKRTRRVGLDGYPIK